MINVLILKGDGINCENEMRYAFEKVGAKAHCLNVHEFCELESLDNFDLLAFPGGFSFGDEIRSGKILAELIQKFHKENLQKFIAMKKPIIGICNGFQILAQLGVFDEDGERNMTLSQNSKAQFINCWANCEVLENDSFWLKNLPKTLPLPIRHGEGKVQFKKAPFVKIVLKYDQDYNGSFELAAGITNMAGNVFGLMPHPEAAINYLLYPNSKDKKLADAPALEIFRNGVEYAKSLKENSL